jgi:sec-independent protein translocase protein TatC
VIRFLLGFGTETLSPLIGVGPYFGFVSRLCLAFGLVFQLPLLVLVLSAIGLVKPRMLLRTWRFAVVIIFVLAAALTPPDVISQVMMAGPVLVLYFGSVLVSLLVVRRKGRQEDGQEGNQD